MQSVHSIPRDAVRVEYIYSQGWSSSYHSADFKTGNQWMDTGIYPDETTVAKFKVRNDNPVTGGLVFGHEPGEWYQNWRFFRHGNTIMFDIQSDRLEQSSGWTSSTAWREFEIGNHYVKDLQTGVELLRGQTIDPFNEYVKAKTLKLNLGEGLLNGRYVISGNSWNYVQIFSHGKIVADFIPIKINNIGYMFDYVTGNVVGSGANRQFGCGPEILSN